MNYLGMIALRRKAHVQESSAFNWAIFMTGRRFSHTTVSPSSLVMFPFLCYEYPRKKHFKCTAMATLTQSGQCHVPQLRATFHRLLLTAKIAK